MRASLVSLVVPVVALLCGTALPVLADPAEDRQLVSINHRLSSLAAQPQSDAPRSMRADANAPVTQAPLAFGVQRPHTTGLQAFLTGPQMMHVVQYFHSVDRVMHYQSHGVDANLWGVFNRGHGINIRFSRRF